MSGYYDYEPLLDLDRPLALAGYLSAETRVIGYRLAALTGLPSVDLDRTIEHFTGMSVWNLIWTEGEERYRELERRYLRSALDAKPAGILTLGDGALIDDDNRELVLAKSHLVTLELDLANCYWRLKASPRTHQEFWHPLHDEPLDGVERLRPFHARRAPGMAAGHHRIPVRGKGLGEIVSELMALAESL